MVRNAVARFGLAIALGMTPMALKAQVSDSAPGMGDSYVTTDGYGLGRIVPGSLQDVTARARAAMIKMKVVEERSRPLAHRWRELRGKKGGLDVSVRLKAQSASSTRVEVEARQGLTGWDTGFAQQVLDAVGTP